MSRVFLACFPPYSVSSEPDNSPYKVPNFNKRRKQQQRPRRAEDYAGSHLGDEPDMASSTNLGASSSSFNRAPSSTNHYTPSSTVPGSSQ